jgi:hypothetical protein
MIDKVLDRLDSGRDLDESMVDSLVDALEPGDGDQWTELEKVLEVAEHPALADDLRRHELPARLEAALAEALDAVLPMLGVRSYGPTYKLADIARRELRREQRKRDAVVDKLESMGDTADEQKRAAKIMGRYVDSEPAPMFMNEMRTLHPALVEQAQDGFDELEPLRRALERRDQLREALETPADVEPVGLRDAVVDLEERLDLDSRQLGLALESDEPIIARLAAAITLVQDDPKLVSRAAHAVDRGPLAAPTLAVVTGLVAPRTARMVFSQFVAEATWQNPELPDAELTDAKIRSILSARCVLPHVGSPMEPMRQQDLPGSVPPGLQDLPERIETLWRVWQQIHSEKTETQKDG